MKSTRIATAESAQQQRINYILHSPRVCMCRGQFCLNLKHSIKRLAHLFLAFESKAFTKNDFFLKQRNHTEE